MCQLVIGATLNGQRAKAKAVGGANCAGRKLLWPTIGARLVALVLLLQLCFLADLTKSEATTANAELLRRVCLDEADVVLASRSQVLELAKKLEEERGGATLLCESTKFDESINAIKAILSDEQLLGDVCSRRTYEKIRAFHTRFVHFYTPELTRVQLRELNDKEAAAAAAAQQQPIPVSLRRFFILFAKQINLACKHNLVARLPSALQNERKQPLIEASEFKLIDNYKEQSKRLMPLAAEYSGIKSWFLRKKSGGKFAKLELLDFASFGQNSLEGARVDPEVGAEKLYLKVRFNDALKRLGDACQMKFRPVYEELFAPVIRLNNLGYAETAKSKTNQLDAKLDEERDFVRWQDIIQACELFKDIEVLHDSSTMAALSSLIVDLSPASASDSSDKTSLNKVEILSREQAEEFKEHMAKQEDQANVYNPSKVELPHEKVPFPASMLIGKQDASDELKAHEAYLRQVISRKTSSWRNREAKVKFIIKKFFHEHRRQVDERDESKFLGRFAMFCARHNMSIRMVLLLIGVTWLSLHFLIG